MRKCIITMKSPTYAMKARNLLSTYGIRAEIVRLDGKYAERGCTSGVSIDYMNCDSARSILARNGIPYSDVVL